MRAPADLSPSVHRRARALAATRGRSLSAVVDELIGTGEGAAEVQQVRRAVHARPACEPCPDSLSYAAAGISGVHGHRALPLPDADDRPAARDPQGRP